MKFKEFFPLFWLNLKVKKRNFVEYVKVVFKYYSNLPFAKTDLLLLGKYLTKNPFKISKNFLKERGETDLYAYGETPLTTFAQIFQRAGIRQTDTVFELGCGRGRGCFWAHHFIHCKVIGIDFVPLFIQKAEQVTKQRKLKGIEFRCEDFLQSDLTSATAIYLYGTCYEEPFLRALAKKLAKLPKGTLYITVSFPLRDYDDEGAFEVLDQFSLPFTWGEGEIYIQKRG